MAFFANEPLGRRGLFSEGLFSGGGGGGAYYGNFTVVILKDWFSFSSLPPGGG